MAKYIVNFSCGHTEPMYLFGKETERQRKIAWWEEQGMCTKCYRAWLAVKMAEDHDEVEVSYRDYKNGQYGKYDDCKIKPGSYNAETKTIILYMPKKEEGK